MAKTQPLLERWVSARSHSSRGPMRSVPPRGSGWVQDSLTDYICSANMLSHQTSFLILIMWNDTDTPLAYFISFRTYGTWLHGDKRGSIDRFHNRYRSPYIPPNEKWQQYNEQQLKAEPMILKARQRKSVEAAIRETCEIRNWLLQALNVRTNHVHTVVSANRKPDLVLNAFKANATRQLRQDGLWSHPFSAWADKGSKRRLWNERSVARAIDYVVDGQ
jgi:REP element-mobilizing transposase RayT